jgi:lipid-binding SYLF domain-containing protein
LLSDKFEIGGEGSAAAGPVGRSASASTDAKTQRADSLLFAQQRCVCGLELKGVVHQADNEDNAQVYGMTARDILTGAKRFPWSRCPKACGLS